MKKITFVTIFAIVIIMALLLVGCTEEGNAVRLIQSSDIQYLSEIQANGDLVFEYLTHKEGETAQFNSRRPTLVIFHGENVEGSFSPNLPKAEYFVKDAIHTTDYTMEDGIGYMGKGGNAIADSIVKYWTDGTISGYNLVVFHWENFAFDNNTADIVAKMYSTAKMRYHLEGDAYETSKVPSYNLTEIVATLFYEEFKDKVGGEEIRFVGNGVGATLALSVVDYLSYLCDNGLVTKDIIPSRLTLCDPYLSTEDMHMPNDTLSWRNISTKEGTYLVTEKLLDSTVKYGLAVEMIETKEGEKVTVDGNTSYVFTPAYEVNMTEKARESEKNIKGKVAHLTFTESYSRRFSDGYKAQKRIALDWYLYSIIGSDDSNGKVNGVAGGGYAVGYPRDIGEYNSQQSNASCNWGLNKTRPMVNNRALNNDGSTSNASTRGKNYALSAWTPTVYTRALKGISFTMQMKQGSASLGNDLHGNATYNMKDFVMEYFRTENYQVSNQSDYTLVCGYVYLDKNGDRYINDGNSGMEGVTLNVVITQGGSSTEADVEVANFNVTTDESGFYAIRLADKTLDSEGAYSEAGYRLNTTHTVKITLIPDSHDYYSIPDVAAGMSYQTMSGHNFGDYTTTLNLKNTYAHAITIANCLVRSNG